jgi:hypothetical protein
MRDECTLKDLKECGSFFKLFEHEIYNININIYIYAYRLQAVQVPTTAREQKPKGEL